MEEEVGRRGLPSAPPRRCLVLVLIIVRLKVGRRALVFPAIRRYLVVPDGVGLSWSFPECRRGGIFASGPAMPVVRGRRRARLGPRRLGAAMAPCLLPRGTFAESPSLPQADERVGLADVQVVEHQVSTGHPRSRHLRRNPPSQEWPPTPCFLQFAMLTSLYQAHPRRHTGARPCCRSSTSPGSWRPNRSCSRRSSRATSRSRSRPCAPSAGTPDPVVPDASAISEVPNRR